MIYHLFSTADGQGAGSGLNPIRNATHDFCDTPPPPSEEDAESVFWDGHVWGDKPHEHPSPDPSEYLPRPKIPATLYPRQLWHALLQRGITEEDVQAKVETLTPVQQRIARIEMKGHVYERLSPWISIIGAMLGLTEADMDDVFIAGAGL